MPVNSCPMCGKPMRYIDKYQRWYCDGCRKYAPVAAKAQVAAQRSVQAAATSSLWLQNQYRIRKKVVALTNQYWIETPQGNLLGYSKQKLLKLKEDIRIYTDESKSAELFRIQQQQILDLWGNFAVIDSATNGVLGYVRRKALSSAFVKDQWEVQGPDKQLVACMGESTGRGMARKYLPGGKLIPEKITLELQGRPVAEINQQFKVIGDIWDINCLGLPPAFDRRVMLSCALLMGMIERDRK